MILSLKKTYPVTEPLFFPFPAKPPPNSTPAQRPGLPSISPKYLRVPSKPRDSTLTLSPTSKALESLFEASDCLLGGRLGRVETGVLTRSGTLIDDDEAADKGRPATERLPEDREWEMDWGEREDVDDVADKGRARWCEGSFALMASASARDISSFGGCAGFDWWTMELERDLAPGVGMALTRPGVGIADRRGFAGVAMVAQQFRATESLKWTRLSFT